MNMYLVDAFTHQPFAGNPAGVVLLDNNQPFPSNAFMLQVAAEMKQSETVFVKPLGNDQFHLRYFTPSAEVDLCGHATIGAFSLLQKKNVIEKSSALALTSAGELTITLNDGEIWMTMAAPQHLLTFNREESRDLYQAFGMDMSHQPGDLSPQMISVGLADILLPVNSIASLNGAVQDVRSVIRLSEQYQSVGFHLFALAPDQGVTAHCRNFAPRFGIHEESATGTASGALTYLLYHQGLIQKNTDNVFLQGAAMGRLSTIKSRLIEKDGEATVLVGGTGVVVMEGRLLPSWK